jgi:hypothetical protein
MRSRPRLERTSRTTRVWGHEHEFVSCLLGNDDLSFYSSWLTPETAIGAAESDAHRWRTRSASAGRGEILRCSSWDETTYECLKITQARRRETKLPRFHFSPHARAPPPRLTSLPSSHPVHAAHHALELRQAHGARARARAPPGRRSSRARAGHTRLRSPSLRTPSSRASPDPKHRWGRTVRHLLFMRR